MAGRKEITRKPNQSSNTNNVVPAKSAEKTKKSNGLFGNLFKKPQQNAERPANRRGIQSQTPQQVQTEKQVVPQEESKDITVYDSGCNEVLKEEVIPQNIAPYQPDDDLRYVFLYAASDKWLQIMKYYQSTFKNVVFLGTQDPKRLVSAFEEKPMSHFVLLFITDRQEIVYCKILLDKLKPTLNLVKPIILMDKSIPKNEIAQFSIYNVLYKQLPDRITADFLNKVMTSIVKSQSIIKKPATPPKAKPKTNATYTLDSVRENIGKINLENVKETIQDIKTNILAKPETMNNVKNILLKGSDQSNAEVVEVQLESNLKHIKFLHEIEDQLNDIILDYKQRGFTKEVKDVVAQKLAVNCMRVAEMDEIITSITTEVRPLIEMKSEESITVNSNMKKLLSTEKDQEALTSLRLTVKENINKLYEEIKGLVTLNNNANSMLNKYLLNSQKAFVEASTVIDDPNLQNTALLRLENIKKNQQILEEQNTSASNLLKASFQKTKELLKEYRILTDIDDILIVDLNEQLQSANNKVARLQAKTKANAFFAFKVGFSAIADFVIDDNFFIFYSGNRKHLQKKLDLDDSRFINFTDFMAIDWNQNQFTIFVDITDELGVEHSTDQINDFLSKFISISNLYDKVIYYREMEDEEIEFSDIEDAILKGYITCANIVTDLDLNNDNRVQAVVKLEKNLLLYSELSIVKVIFNKVLAPYQTELETYQILLNKQQHFKLQSVLLPYMSSLDSPTPILSQKKVKAIQQLF